MSNTAFFGSTSCTAAPPGSYISQFGSPVAMFCPQGSFSSSAGAWNCTRCGTNDFQDNLGSTECARCPNGTLQDNNGTSCRYCSLGRYQAYMKSSSAFPEQNSPPRTCRACPHGNTVENVPTGVREQPCNQHISNGETLRNFPRSSTLDICKILAVSNADIFGFFCILGRVFWFPDLCCVGSIIFCPNICSGWEFWSA